MQNRPPTDYLSHCPKIATGYSAIFSRQRKLPRSLDISTWTPLARAALAPPTRFRPVLRASALSRLLPPLTDVTRHWSLQPPRDLMFGECLLAAGPGVLGVLGLPVGLACMRRCWSCHAPPWAVSTPLACCSAGRGHPARGLSSEQ
jgi:hypothetical protein